MENDATRPAGPATGRARTYRVDSKPTVRWLPSQNGWFRVPPHRQSATRSASRTISPAAVCTRTRPWSTSGPSLVQRDDGHRLGRFRRRRGRGHAGAYTTQRPGRALVDRQRDVASQRPWRRRSHFRRRTSKTAGSRRGPSRNVSSGVPDGIRTRVLALKGPRPNPWTTGTCLAGCSPAALPRSRRTLNSTTRLTAPATAPRRSAAPGRGAARSILFWMPPIRC